MNSKQSEQARKELVKLLAPRYLVMSAPIEKVEAWIYKAYPKDEFDGKARDGDTAGFSVFLKCDMSRSFLTAGREAGEDWPNGAKTINRNTLEKVSKLRSKLLIIFYDPQEGYRAIWDRDINAVGVAFTQKVNGEKVIGIDVRELRPLEEVIL